MWRRNSILYSPERVERLRQFSDLLIEAAVLRRQRVELVERLRPFVQNSILLQKVNVLIEEATYLYPNYSVSVSLINDLTNDQFSCNYISHSKSVPWNKTFCQYAIASGKPFEVTDSLTDLVVCNSPNAIKIRSYNGVPLIINSWVVGVICIYSDSPREEWDFLDKTRLKQWADKIGGLLEIELSQQL